MKLPHIDKAVCFNDLLIYITKLKIFCLRNNTFVFEVPGNYNNFCVDTEQKLLTCCGSSITCVCIDTETNLFGEIVAKITTEEWDSENIITNQDTIIDCGLGFRIF